MGVKLLERQDKFIFGQLEFEVPNRHLLEFSKVTDMGNRFKYQFGRQKDQIMILLLGGKEGWRGDLASCSFSMPAVLPVP